MQLQPWSIVVPSRSITSARGTKRNRAAGRIGGCRWVRVGEHQTISCIRRSANSRYTAIVLRSTSRARFGRPLAARPRPAALPSVDEALSTETPEPVSFDELSLSLAMQHTVAELGFTVATPIQAGSLPFALAGRDVIGQAQTGSGKTAAFGIPIIERLDPRDGPVQALVALSDPRARGPGARGAHSPRPASRAAAASRSTAATRSAARWRSCARVRISSSPRPAGSAITSSDVR